MKKTTLSIIAFATALSAAPIHAQEIDLKLSNDMLEAHNSARILPSARVETRLDLGFLYKDDRRNSSLGILGAQAHHTLASGSAPGLTFRGGGRLFLGDVADYDFSAFGLLGAVDYTLPSASRFQVSVQLDWAPKIFSFNDAEGLTGITFQVNYLVLNDAWLYAGYRELEADVVNINNIEIDKGAFIGFRLPLGR